MDNPTFGSRPRTFMCGVVFVDIVEYSKRTVAKQLAQKGWLNEMLADALKGIEPTGRIVLDTGDGVAICFLGDPEEALFVTSCIRVALARSEYPEFALRIGVNIGPVKAVKDLNGQSNVVGDGINVAQRIMSFAEPNQILVSRAYYEVVSHLSEDYVRVFRYLGEREDKHARLHELYEIHAPQAALEPAAEPVRDAPQARGESEKRKGTPFDADDLARLEELLADIVGPMASMLVADAAATASTRREIISALGDAVDDPEDRSRFVAGARDALAHRLD